MSEPLLFGEMSPEEALRRAERWLDYFASNMGENPADYQAFDFIKKAIAEYGAKEEK